MHVSGETKIYQQLDHIQRHDHPQATGQGLADGSEQLHFSKQNPSHVNGVEKKVEMRTAGRHHWAYQGSKSNWCRYSL